MLKWKKIDEQASNRNVFWIKTEQREREREGTL